MSSASRKAPIGVTSLGLATTVQPAAKAAAIFQIRVWRGKFHGAIAATTPTGFFSVMPKTLWS